MVRKGSSQRQIQSEPATFEIMVQGRLIDHWTEWFGEQLKLVALDQETDRTTFMLRVLDQVALLGYLQKITDLGYPLLFVRRTNGADHMGGNDNG